MFERFTREARRAVTSAVTEAEARGDGYVGTEHLLLGVLGAGRAGEARAALARHGVDLADAREALDDLDVEALAAVGVEIAHLGPPAVRLAPRRRRHLPFTTGAKNVLVRALRVAVDRGDRRIGSEHLLLALLAAEPPDVALRLLDRLGVDRPAVRRLLEGVAAPG